MVDLYSKWLDVVIVLFSQHSEFTYHLLNPEVIMSDNGAPSQGGVSVEFKEFLSRMEFNMSYYIINPKSNGQVERSVQTLKIALKKSTNSSLQTSILFLFKY